MDVLIENEKYKEYLKILHDYAGRQGKPLEELIWEAEERKSREYIKDLRKRAIEYDRIKKSTNDVR